MPRSCLPFCPALWKHDLQLASSASSSVIRPVSAQKRTSRMFSPDALVYGLGSPRGLDPGAVPLRLRHQAISAMLCLGVPIVSQPSAPCCLGWTTCRSTTESHR